MTDFSFLDNVQVIEVQPSMGRQTSKAEPNPTDSDLRLFKDGSLYPSLPLTKEFDLEYQDDATAIRENGFDLINSDDWGMMPKGTPQFLAIATVPKEAAPKPMLFGKSRKVDGKSVHSVNDQGSMASGKTLIEYIEATEAKAAMEVAFEAQGFIDLDIIREHPIASANGIYNFPRLVKKGDNAGNLTSIRRENSQIYPLIVVPMAQDNETDTVHEIDLEEEAIMEVDNSTEAQEQEEISDLTNNQE